MIRKILLLLLSLLLLTSCSPRGNDTISADLYYFNTSDIGEMVSVEKNYSSSQSNKEIITDIFSTLRFSDSKDRSSMLPPSVSLENATVSDGLAILYLSPRYSKCDPSSKTFIKACLSKTICSLPFVDKIIISSNGITESVSDFDFVTEALKASYKTYKIHLYFPDETLTSLLRETRTVALEPNASLEKTALDLLLAGPTADGLVSVISDETSVNSVVVNDGGTCIIDFSKAFLDSAGSGKEREELILYSVVNTITELPMINNVQFLIDGERRTGFEHFDLQKTFTNNESLFKKYNRR